MLIQSSINILCMYSLYPDQFLTLRAFCECVASDGVDFIVSSDVFQGLTTHLY